MTALLLICHNETYADRLSYIQGTLNSRLTTLAEQGIADAEAYQEVLKHNQIDFAYTSPLKRALATDKTVCNHTNTNVRVSSRLSEISYERWSEAAIADLKRQYITYPDSETNDVYPRSIEINNGESFVHTRKRVWTFVTEIPREYPSQTILVVTYGWIVKNIVSLCLNNTDGTAFKSPRNLSVGKIQVDPVAGKQKVCYYNRPLRGTGKL